MRRHFGTLVLCFLSLAGCAREGTQSVNPGSDVAVAEDTGGTDKDLAGSPSDLTPAEELIPTEDASALPDTHVAPDQEPSDATQVDETVDTFVNETWPEDAMLGVVGPAVVVMEGEVVEVQTLLHLKAVAPEGYEPAVYTWKVTQPDGSRFTFQPSHTVANPTFEANLVGHYVFSVTMDDESGAPIPPPDPFEVDAVSSAKIHVELVWHTPADSDETDTGPDCGSDMDLHFTHPWANQPDSDQDGLPDPWFDNLFDCFWFNTDPNWGSYQVDINDNPGLDRDDTDGAGPENLNLAITETLIYRVGVHFWNEHGYGPSEATVRIYFDGELASVLGPLTLVDKDMWDVCQIDATTTPPTVIPVTLEDGSPKVTPEYANPYFYQ